MKSNIVVVGYNDVLEELANASKTREDIFKIIFIGIEFTCAQQLRAYALKPDGCKLSLPENA